MRKAGCSRQMGWHSVYSSWRQLARDKLAPLPTGQWHVARATTHHGAHTQDQPVRIRPLVVLVADMADWHAPPLFAELSPLWLLGRLAGRRLERAVAERLLRVARKM